MHTNLSKLEKFNREKMPACLKSLLTSSGYNTLFSLCKLDIGKIREIEQYIGRNRKLLDNLKCCFAKEYQEQAEFEFLPGHKNILLNIPGQISEMKSTVKNNTSSKSKPAEICNQTPKQMIPDSEVKRRLVKNLFGFAVKIGFELPEDSISESNILFFARGSEEDEFLYKCKFSCPLCEKSSHFNIKHSGRQAMWQHIWRIICSPKLKIDKSTNIQPFHTQAKTITSTFARNAFVPVRGASQWLLWAEHFVKSAKIDSEQMTSSRYENITRQKSRQWI